jgi:quercetin dioxygenase-like cupin family protein
VRAIVPSLALAALALAPLQQAGRSQAPGAERTTRIDNATVAVTRLAFPPGMREEVHTHPFPLVIVQVTPGNPTVVDREMRRVGGGPGEVWFMPAGTPHAMANNGTAAFDVLAIAIKPDRPPAPAAPPTDAPPGITRATLVDNADVRVVRVRFAPEGREPMHTHPNDLLTVQITPGKVTMVKGGHTSTVDCEPGYVQFLPRGVQHSYASADSKPFELLSVSIK